MRYDKTKKDTYLIEAVSIKKKEHFSKLKKILHNTEKEVFFFLST